jgi:RHS repeat-associated protein
MDIYQNQTPTPYYLHHNLIGSVTGITDENGNLIELVEYDPYGKPYFLKPTGNPQNPYELSESSTIGNTTLFQGREYDPETGLYYFRARYYDPELGRFLSPDPKRYLDSMNLYQAFSLNPINFVDSLGEFTIYVADADIYSDYMNDFHPKLDFRFKFEFTSPAEVAKVIGEKLLETIIGHYAKKVGLESIHWILKGKGLLEKFLAIKDIRKQKPTIRNPFVYFKDLSDIEKWKEWINYKLIEIETDPPIEELYRKLYGNKALTTEEAIQFMKIVKEKFPQVIEIYPWEELLPIAVSEWEESYNFSFWFKLIRYVRSIDLEDYKFLRKYWEEEHERIWQKREINR